MSARDPETREWVDVCAVEDIVPDTGVCARLHGHHVAVFRLGREAYYALDNVDPRSGASVLSRGVLGSLGDRLVVASPMHKNHFDLRTGECLEAPHQSVRAYEVRVIDGRVRVALV
jgi:nitrite reductase (NADH) small subunit